MRSLAIVSILLILTGCASILSDSQYPITFNSNPSGADLEITNRHGDVVYQGRSPTTITLRAGSGFFRGERYTVKATLNSETGTATLTPGVDGWYIGNILFGGLVGILIVDPATGAMYKLPDKFSVNLAPTNASTKEPQLRVLNIDDVTDEMREGLIAVN